MTPTAATPTLPLADHHHAIAAACIDLRTEVYADDKLSLIDAYRRFEHAVILHLEIEEHELLPGFGEDSSLAAQLRAQHVELRERLYRLGVEVELHRARADQFEGLIDALQRHLALEQATLYPWADRNLTLETRRMIFVRIGRSLRELATLHERHAA